MNTGRIGKAISGLRQAREKRRRDAFERLTRPHVSALHRTAFRMTGDRHVAEDLVQETCLKAYRAFDRFKDGTNYQAWIFRIMSNLCTDHLRRTARAPFVAWNEDEVSGPMGAYSSEQDRPDVHFLHASFRNDALRAMSRLSPEVRLVVALALLEGFSYEEIADVADCPVGTVRSRLNRGRLLLQKELRHYVPSKTDGKESESGSPASVKPRC